MIDIISKKPTGTWTGKVNNMVGHFKFINVQLLPDEDDDEDDPEESGDDEVENMGQDKVDGINVTLEDNLTRLSHLEVASIPYEGDYSRDEDYYYNTCTRTWFRLQHTKETHEHA